MYRKNAGTGSVAVSLLTEGIATGASATLTAIGTGDGWVEANRQPHCQQFLSSVKLTVPQFGHLLSTVNSLQYVQILSYEWGVLAK
jgi:hypothetical protein